MPAPLMEGSLNRWCYFDERKDEKTKNAFEKNFLLLATCTGSFLSGQTNNKPVGEDLVVWLRLDSKDPINITLEKIMH